MILGGTSLYRKDIPVSKSDLSQDPQPELLTATIHVLLPPSARAEIDRLAKIEDRKPATVARRLILAALQQQKDDEVIF